MKYCEDYDYEKRCEGNFGYGLGVAWILDDGSAKKKHYHVWIAKCKGDALEDIKNEVKIQAKYHAKYNGDAVSVSYSWVPEEALRMSVLETTSHESGPQCPYCKEIIADDSGEDPVTTWHCEGCDKKFKVECDYDITYYSKGIPCLNGAPHKYKKCLGATDYWAGQPATPHRCEWCDDTDWVKNEGATNEEDKNTKT